MQNKQGGHNHFSVYFIQAHKNSLPPANEKRIFQFLNWDLALTLGFKAAVSAVRPYRQQKPPIDGKSRIYQNGPIILLSICA